MKTNTKFVIPAKAGTDAPPGALETLTAALAADMRGVNEIILKNLQSEVALIPQVASYLIAAGGKRLRPLLTVASARLCDAADDTCHGLAAAVEFIHSASLLHDDVVDESHLRRGQPSANDTFGNQASILVGDFLFARGFELMVAAGSLEVLKILAHTSALITEGEVLQLSLAGNIATREVDYLRVIEAKTASLFSAATEVGAILGGGTMRDAMRDFGYHFGMAFQLIDDVLDYSADAAALNKNLGDDFREGKLTCPVILAIHSGDATEKDFWREVLMAETHTPGMFTRAQSLMRKHHVFDAVRQRAENHAAQARQAIQQLPQQPLREQLLDVLDYCVNRTT